MPTETPITDSNCWETLAGAMRCKPTVEHAYVPACIARNMELENARLRELLGDVLSHSVNAGMYPDGPCLESRLRTDIKEACVKAASVFGAGVDAYSSAKVEQAISAVEAYIRGLIRAGDYMADATSDRRRLIWAEARALEESTKDAHGETRGT